MTKTLPATRWWNRLDSLRVKLFLAIAGANTVLVLAAYLIYGWSFDRGLIDYLNRADDVRLAPVIERLAAAYQAQGNWLWIKNDREQLHRILHDELGLPASRGGESPGRPEAPPGRAEGSPGRGGRPPWIEGELLLVDQNRELVVGSAQSIGRAWLTPIAVQGEVVGYLGRTPRRELVESLEQAASARQGSQFAVIAFALLLAVLVNAALISRWLGRRLAAIGASATAVAQGNYSVRLPERGHDELSLLARDFNHMAASLEAAQAARQRWIADIAHELRTPLASLRAEIEALQDGVRRPTPDRLDSLAQEVGRLTRLVEDLRLLSLSDFGALDYRTELLDFGEFVADYLDDVSAKLPAGWQLQRDLAAGLRMRADADRLGQVLANLFQNTLRYTDSPGTLRVGLRNEAGEACLTWEDSAPGVPAEALARLTDRLYRLDESRAREGGGSGLGLAIARALVEGHGGDMRASASSLGGLRWDIHLPLATEANHG
jgi:two-component system, OmpR family, sensor histidine kinase BaeS